MTSGAWRACPACDLRHSPRPDGRCPRCGAEVVPSPDALGAARRPSPSAVEVPSLRDDGPLGPRLAGGVFVILGAASALFASVREAAPGMARIGPAAVALVVILLGISLLRGSDVARRLALVLVALTLAAAAVAGTVATRQPAAVVLGAFCGAALLLLAGNAGPRRIAAAGVLLAAGLALGVVGLPGLPPVARELFPRLFR